MKNRDVPVWEFGRAAHGRPGTRIGSGFRFTEGPVWLPPDVAEAHGLGRGAGLHFSDIDSDTTYFGRCDGLDVVRSPSGRSNGNALDPSGSILSCEHDSRRIARHEPGSEAGTEWVTVVDSFDGQRLNSPNDLCCRSDGVILFTDPPYGVADIDREIAMQGVYAVDAGGRIMLIDANRSKPNGLALDPRHDDVVWVADTERGEIVRYSLGDDLTVAEIGIVSGLDRPDGLAFDQDDNLLVAVVDGVDLIPAADTANCANAQRRRLAIEMEERPANLCIVDESLFVCARTSIWRFHWPTDDSIVAVGDGALTK